MTLERGITIGFVVMTALGIGGWWVEKQNTLRAEGRAEVYEEQRDSLKKAEAEARAQVELVDQQATSRILQAETAREEAEARARRVSARNPEIVERIVHAPDTAAIRAAVAELEDAQEDALEEVHASYQAALAAQDSIIQAQARQIAARDQADRRKDELLANLEGQLGTRRSPGTLEKWGDRAIAVGIGAALGYGLSELLGG